MLTLTLQPLHVRGVDAMGIPQPEDKEVEYALRKIRGIRWSTGAKLWYLPLSREHYRLLLEGLQGKALLNTTPPCATIWNSEGLFFLPFDRRS